MIAIPAIDLREGACVQLVGGSYADERIRLENPVDVARRWVQHGFNRLHVVDLDAATARGTNADVVREILWGTDVMVQVGGGVRTSERVDELVEQGAHLVVVGTRAIEDQRWLEEIAETHPGRIVVAADVRERAIVTHGWMKSTRRLLSTYLDSISGLPLGGILVTAVHKEGLLQGTDLHLMEDVVEAVSVPVLASGGISSRRDLDDLADCGVHGAIIGMALYTGALAPQLLAEEYA